MARTTSAITTSGGLLPSDLLARLAADPQALSGTRPEEYHLPPGRRLRDAISRAWSELLGQWTEFRDRLDRLPEGERATTITRETWLLPLLTELGFGRLAAARGGLSADSTSYPISHAWGPVPIHLLGADVDLDRSAPGVAGAARSSPHALVQDFLNRSDDHLWAIVSNGRVLRLLRDHTSLTRPAYVEFDLQAIFEAQSFADFAVLWLLCHQSRFEADRPEDCWLERWAAEARQMGVRALAELRDGFEAAIRALGSGFLTHPANSDLRRRLHDGDLRASDYHHQVLRLVYRLVFLLVTEDRDLLSPDPDSAESARYRAYYSMSRIRDLAERGQSSQHGDLWESLRPVFGALGINGSPALGLPALGSFLWSGTACIDLDSACLSNAALLEAFTALAFTHRDKARQRVDFAHLGPEELGGVYESLLELQPQIDLDTSTFTLVVAAGHERKTTGSYYTPTPLVSELLDSALEPVLDEAAAQPDPESSLLAVTVLDPACGSGHFLIAAAERIARRLASARTGEPAPAPSAVGHALRDVVSHCVYGIDANAMAIELAKVNLWLAAMEPGKPLSFLDHHLAHGNALLGTTPDLVAQPIPDEAFKPLTGDDKSTADSWRKANAKDAKEARAGINQLALGSPIEALITSLAERSRCIDGMPDQTPEAVEAKAAAYADLSESADLIRARLAADAWCAPFFLPKTPGSCQVTSSTVASLAEGTVPDQAVLDAVNEVRDSHGFLHWHLAFPGVFQRDRGFSVVIGNPPWDKVKLSEKEFFATRYPEIAKAAGVKRKALITRLQVEDPGLWDEYRTALRSAEAESVFLRTSGRYPLCGRGDVNTYAVFAEAMCDGLALTGRLGVVLPTGIATDDTTKAFFADCVTNRRLVSLKSFENEALVFPGVHHAFRFCLLTLSGPRGVPEDATFSFFLRRVSDLSDAERSFTLSPEDLELLNPNTRTAPVFHSRTDAELTKKIYRRVPVLVREGNPDSNPWGIELSTMFHMTNDSGLFASAVELGALGAELDGNTWRKGSDVWLPLYEGKMIHHYTHRWGDYALQPEGRTHVELPDVPDRLLADRDYVVTPRYWVAEREVLRRLPTNGVRWLLGFRDITSATVERTLIAAAFPMAAVGNKVPLLFPSADPKLIAFLPATLTSFVCDYAARQKIGGTTLNFFIAKQLPVLPPMTFTEPAPWSPRESVASWMKPRILELTYTARDMAGYAADLDFDGPPFIWDTGRRRKLRAELDGAFFHLYGLDRPEVEYVMDTFPIVRRRDEATHGEYLTKRLILEQYDELS